jgi:hypothetical protein
MAKGVINDVWTTWQATKEQLMDLDAGFFKQALLMEFIVDSCVCGGCCVLHSLLFVHYHVRPSWTS